MLPTIELWDLDVLDAVEPVLVLGRAAAVVEGEAAGGGARKKKGKGGAGEVPSDSHTGAVMGLAWNGACARQGVLGDAMRGAELRPRPRSRVPQRACLSLGRRHRQGVPSHARPQPQPRLSPPSP